MLLFSQSPVWPLATSWTAARQDPLPSTVSQSLLKFMSTESVMLLTVSSSAALFLCLQSFPASRSFPMSWLLASGGQSIGASASVLPMNIQGWSPLGWTVGSPCSPRDSQESSPTPQFKSINSSALSLLYGPTLTSYWKNHGFDYIHSQVSSMVGARFDAENSASAHQCRIKSESLGWSRREQLYCFARLRGRQQACAPEKQPHIQPTKNWWGVATAVVQG